MRNIVHNMYISLKIRTQEGDWWAREFASWRTRRPRFVAQALAVSCPVIPRMWERTAEGNPAWNELSSRRGTRRSRPSDTTRWTRVTTRPSAFSVIRHITPTASSSREWRATSTLSRGIVGQYFLREHVPRVYERAQNGRQQKRSTVRERERASERMNERASEKTPRFSLSPFLSRFLLRPRSPDTYRCTYTYIYTTRTKFSLLSLCFIIHRSYNTKSGIIFHR